MKLFAAVPTHQLTMTVEAVETLVNAQSIVTGRGGVFLFGYQSGSEISSVRNRIVATFLQSGYDRLMMLDADQGIAYEALERMISLNEPVVGCIYPMRVFRWHSASLETSGSGEQLLRRANAFVGSLLPDQSGLIQVKGGFAKAERIGAGILLIQRNAFETLMAAYPDLRNAGFKDRELTDTEHNWGFFNPILQEDGLPISEDFSFCQRWHDAGGDIWAEVCGEVSHVGRHVFKGNYLEYLRDFQKS